MIRFIRNFYVEITGILVLGAFLYLLTSGYGLLFSLSELIRSGSVDLGPKWQNMSTIFLSIFIEGLPFILFGVFLSCLIHVYVKEETIWRWTPKNPLLSIPMATCLGLLLPVCECGIVPVARRLVQKGLPPYVAFTFLLAVPIVNPITILSTYFAFGDSWDMVFARTLTGAGIAALMGFLFYLFFRRVPVLKEEKQTACTHEQGSCGHESHAEERHVHHPEDRCDHHAHAEGGKWMHALHHAVFEFINMGKYFVLGALIAAGFQTFVGLSAIKSFSEQEGLALLMMMGLAFCLSICSNADAFLAASFRSAMGTVPLLGFLIYGPMMDLKNLLMMLGSFRLPVILFFFGGTTILTLLSVFLLF
ncbi:permease [Lihuaxuella thermophila]|uniref:Permease n=1 Tax=Lihuaxuella thermophila TaxID=1173111 RepID=A0A1H8GTU6_9BACL|nr:permease [Lihuaxuella thermophila]SEN47386.1 hypothetical protein SAMN05444955_11270 [Lihuaxuella thermophila]